MFGSLHLVLCNQKASVNQKDLPNFCLLTTDKKCFLLHPNREILQNLSQEQNRDIKSIASVVKSLSLQGLHKIFWKLCLGGLQATLQSTWKRARNKQWQTSLKFEAYRRIPLYMPFSCSKRNDFLYDDTIFLDCRNVLDQLAWFILLLLKLTSVSVSL